MNDSVLLLVIVVGTAIAFDFTTGFHDTANAMATSIATRAPRPRAAVALCALLNFAGAFLSIKVAATISSGIVDEGVLDLRTLFAGSSGRSPGPSSPGPPACRRPRGTRSSAASSARRWHWTSRPSAGASSGGGRLMRRLLSAVVDLAALWKIIVAVVIAGVGVTAAFGEGAIALARIARARRDGVRDVSLAASYVVVALSAVVCAAALVLGFVAMTHK
jgi:hypothetical protein